MRADAGKSLTPGANLTIAQPVVRVAIGWEGPGRAGVIACLTDKANKVAGKAALVAPSAPRGGGGAVVLDSSAGATGLVYAATFAAIPAEIEKIIFCVVVAEGETASAGELGLSLVLSGDDGPIASFDLTDDAAHSTAALIGELYRRNDDWKFKAIGQGFQNGTEPLAKYLGCDSRDLREAGTPAPPSPPPAPPPSPPPPPPPPPSSPARPAAAARTEAAAGSGRRAQSAPPPPPAPADQFSCRGWVLTAEGVGTADAAGLGRELLDLRADPQGRLWPAIFERQPITGEALEPAPRLVVTTGRSLGETGLPQLGAVTALDPESRESEAVPPGAQIFAAGGTPPRLVAVDSAAGKAWWKAPWTGKWAPIGRCPPGPLLPAHALGLAGTAEGVFFGAETALVNLLPDQQAACFATPFEGAPIAAPAALGAVIALPIRGPDGLAVFIRLPGGETRIVPVAAADESWREEEPLGEAATDAETAYWVGTRGFIALEDALDAPVAYWRRWPAKVEGLPFLRPYLAANGRFWAMCRESEDGLALACAMTVAGPRDKRSLLGPHLSVGRRTYRDHDRYDAPWDDPAETVKLGADYEGRWILPLLRLGNGATVVALVKEETRSGSSRGFVFREDAPAPRDVTLALHAENRGLTLLNHVLRISSTDEIEIFVDADRLCIHHAESNTCASWSISF